jgi:hypothetical protein
MKNKKAFTAPVPVVVATTPPTEPPADGANSLIIALPEHAGSHRNLDLTPWLDQGIDAWVHACAGQLRVFLHGKSVEATTLGNYWYAGLRYFFEHLVAVNGPSAPILLKPQHIRGFLGWLSEQGWSYGTQKARFDFTKSVLSALVRRQIIPKQGNLFPTNPFPGSNKRQNGQTPLSNDERQRLATALRDELIAIHQVQFDGVQSHALVVYVLAVAIRCGANTVPLLEATRDCLQDHPFMPTMKRLMLFKRRGSSTKIIQLRSRKHADDSVSVTMDGVALIKKALAYSEALVKEAKIGHQNRLWLYRSESVRYAGKVLPLTGATLAEGISALIKRHNLRGDDGKRIRLNLSRLRKTVEMRLFELSGGDLITTAALMGHDPKVADMHYLACTQKMKENATFVGEALPDIYRNADQKVISILPEMTPAGRCKDPYQGDKAPKDGTPCDDFFACFACTSYAITGSPDDLHRLFSFYFFLEREMHHAKTEGWRTEFRHTMLLIDRFTADMFVPEVVAVARERARITPIGFWAAYALSEAANG